MLSPYLMYIQTNKPYTINGNSEEKLTLSSVHAKAPELIINSTNLGKLLAESNAVTFHKKSNVQEVIIQSQSQNPTLTIDSDCVLDFVEFKGATGIVYYRDLPQITRLVNATLVQMT